MQPAINFIDQGTRSHCIIPIIYPSRESRNCSWGLMGQKAELPGPLEAFTKQQSHYRSKKVAKKICGTRGKIRIARNLFFSS